MMGEGSGLGTLAHQSRIGFEFEIHLKLSLQLGSSIGSRLGSKVGRYGSLVILVLIRVRLLRLGSRGSGRLMARSSAREVWLGTRGSEPGRSASAHLDSWICSARLGLKLCSGFLEFRAARG